MYTDKTMLLKKLLIRFLLHKQVLNQKKSQLVALCLWAQLVSVRLNLQNNLQNNLSVHLARFDMSEYQEKHSVSKLIGSPPGYVGHDDHSGQLINQLQEHPNCVLLLDEIEKAHPDIAQILLQIMDNGKITGSDGKEADARNCILILTTNLGAAQAEKNTIGFSEDFEENTETKNSNVSLHQSLEIDLTV